MRVWKSTTAPTELPGYAAANGPYSTSTRSISSGVTRPQRGVYDAPLPSRFESRMPSAYTSERALLPVPEARLASTAWS